MLILLPPSEGKTEGIGAPFKAKELSFAKELGAARAEVMDALVRVSSGPRVKALMTLGLTPSMAPLLVRNASLAKAPASPAMEIYSGVLYEALGWSTVPAKGRKRGEGSILISSALFGVVRPADRIPAYRLSMDVALPRLGGLAAYWRKHLTPVLNAHVDDLVLDCRSSTYAASWTPQRDVTYAVKVMTEKAGKRTVVSHMAKYSRGVLARLLLEAAKAPRTIDDVATIAAAEFKVELSAPAKGSGVLTLITRG